MRGVRERLAPPVGLERALGGAETAYERYSIDVRDAASNGREFSARHKHLHVVATPPGAQVSVALHSKTNERIPVRAGQTISFLRTDGPTKFYVFWTQNESANASAERRDVEILGADDFAIVQPTERVEVIPTPSTGGSAGQAKCAVAGTAVQLTSTYTPCEEVMVTAPAENTQPVTVGFSSAVNNTTNGTGTGDVLSPGVVKTFPVDSPSRLWVNAKNTTDYVSWIVVSSRR